MSTQAVDLRARRANEAAKVPKLYGYQRSDSIWDNNFEDGTLGNIIRFANNNVTSSTVINDPTGRTPKVMQLMSDTSNGNNAGNRCLVDRLQYRPDPQNNPDDCYYSTWFYLINNQSVNNLFQYKQKWRPALAPHLGGNYNGQTALHMYDVGVINIGGDVHDLKYSSRLRDDGQWWTSGGARLTPETRAVLPGAVRTGEWHHIEWRHRYSEDQDIGRIEIWFDGVQFVNETRVTNLPYVQEIGNEPIGVTWQVIGDTTYLDHPRQWAVNNYMYGNGPWSPNRTHNLFDDMQMRLKL